MPQANPPRAKTGNHSLHRLHQQALQKIQKKSRLTRVLSQIFPRIYSICMPQDTTNLEQARDKSRQAFSQHVLSAFFSCVKRKTTSKRFLGSTVAVCSKFLSYSICLLRNRLRTLHSPSPLIQSILNRRLLFPPGTFFQNFTPELAFTQLKFKLNWIRSK